MFVKLLFIVGCVDSGFFFVWICGVYIGTYTSMINWKDILVFVWYMLLITIPPLVFWYIIMYSLAIVDVFDMLIGIMQFLPA